MKYSIIQNNQLLIALPAEEVLTDLMFEKGWRSMVAEASLREVAAVGATLWDPIEFYKEYLAEDPLDPCDVKETYYEDKGAPPDADEEEFDEFFVPDEETDTSERF